MSLFALDFLVVSELAFVNARSDRGFLPHQLRQLLELLPSYQPYLRRYSNHPHTPVPFGVAFTPLDGSHITPFYYFDFKFKANNKFKLLNLDSIYAAGSQEIQII